MVSHMHWHRVDGLRKVCEDPHCYNYEDSKTMELPFYTQKHYVVIYENLPQCKGMDAFLCRADGDKKFSNVIEDARLFSSFEAAHAASHEVPIYDEAHCVARVVKCETKAVKVTSIQHKMCVIK